MNVFPVIHRELQVQSRSGWNFGLRLIGAAALLMLGSYIWSTEPLEMEEGGLLFRFLHFGLITCIWLVFPLFTADVISRERRQGTLDLLFLAPLSTPDVVIAKGMGQALKAVTFSLATIPVLVIPFLLGGVDWWLVGYSLIANLSSASLALAAGLLASSANRVFHRTLVWTYVWAFFSFLALLFIAGSMAIMVLNWPWSWIRCMAMGWTTVIDPTFLLQYFSRQTTNLPPSEIIGSWVCISLGALTITVIFVFASAFIVDRLRQMQAPSPARQKWQKTLFTPRVAVGFYRKWLQKKLQRNPAGWLEQRTWQARLLTWSWLAVLTGFYSLLLLHSDLRAHWIYGREFLRLQTLLAWLMMFSMALASAGSFRRERESGFLELILVSPISSGQLLWGRLRGIWGQFLPAFLLWGLVWVYIGTAIHDAQYWHWDRRNLQDPIILHVLVWVGPYIGLPVAGLYFSLRCRYLLTATGWTLAVLAGESLVHHFTLPLVTSHLFAGEFWGHGIIPPAWKIVLYWTIVIACFGYLLHRNLHKRQFVMQLA